ncbi:MAG: hypothetical protein GYA55_07365 [SAR324 cluster bacterium]|uniref:Uncharacterized protein n=1 Tax=SAR324 cluster bacterium TaxID=2024889 RepID=A0A7X9FS95_9DELT|nr:hypothetical protein [SAR324 cluster bacterium]
MNTSENACLAVHSLHSSVQNQNKLSANLPKGAIHLSLVKTLETELQKRRLINDVYEVLSPLWFLAETERNVYLWRSGLSIEQEDEFEFWVDIPALIKKRMEQLSSFDSGNPFMNPLWGLSIADEQTIEKEKKYLNSLFDLIDEIKEHLEALCIAASTVSRELDQNKDSKSVVVLPIKKFAKSKSIQPLVLT